MTKYKGHNLNEILAKYGLIPCGVDTEDIGGAPWATTVYSKRLDDRTKHLCQLNDRLSLYVSASNYKGVLSWEVQIRAELQTSDWVDLKFYSLQYSDLNNLPKYEEKLLAMWEAANVA